jgi:hypothetical protein
MRAVTSRPTVSIAVRPSNGKGIDTDSISRAHSEESKTWCERRGAEDRHRDADDLGDVAARPVDRSQLNVGAAHRGEPRDDDEHRRREGEDGDDGRTAAATANALANSATSMVREKLGSSRSA